MSSVLNLAIASLSPRLPMQRGLFSAKTTTVASAFAENIVKRTGLVSTQSSGQATEQLATTPNQESSTKAQKIQALEQALAGTVQYMADTFSATTADTMIGLVYKNLGDKVITEESLGEALLQVTRFVDATFGTQEGDNFLDFLNQDLNTSMNALFDNGKSEVFYAVPATPSTPISTVQNAHAESGVTNSLDDLTTNVFETLLDNLSVLRKKNELPPHVQAYLTMQFDDTPATGIMLTATA